MPSTHGIVVFIQALIKKPSQIPRRNSSSKPDCVAFASLRADKEASNSTAHVNTILRCFAIPSEHHDFSFFVCPSKKQSRQSHVRKAWIRHLNRILSSASGKSYLSAQQTKKHIRSRSVLGIGYSGTTRGGGPGGYPPNSTLLG
jgi:hypothetical protein